MVCYWKRQRPLPKLVLDQMKNLLIYISPNRSFVSDQYNWSSEVESLIKIQIDNSLELGWKRKDILLVTSFDYEYEGVKALVIGDDNFNHIKPTATKINAIITLYNMGIISDDIFWYHDNDAFQLQKITEGEAKQMLDGYDLALTDYGKTVIHFTLDKRWSTGTIFFDTKAEYIFDIWKRTTDAYRANEEVVLLDILKKKRFQYLKKRINRINITYNFATRRRDIVKTYEIADKPLKVIHFHPFDRRPVDRESENANLEVCVYGKNRLGKPLVTKRLKKLFKKNGII